MVLLGSHQLTQHQLEVDRQPTYIGYHQSTIGGHIIHVSSSSSLLNFGSSNFSKSVIVGTSMKTASQLLITFLLTVPNKNDRI